VRGRLPPSFSGSSTTLAAFVCGAGGAFALLALPAFVSFEDACRLHLDASRASPIRAPLDAFFLGTDPLGRSEALRLAYAVRTSLGLALPSTLAASASGLAFGALAGASSHKRAEGAFYRFADTFALFAFDVLLAVPFVLVVACAAALVESVTPSVIVAIMTFASAPAVAKLARDRVVAAYAEGFVAAASALGASTGFVLWRHVLPRALAAVAALAPSLFGQLLLAEAALGFLGLGLPPPAASLGTMLADGQDFVGEAPWLLAFPACVPALLVRGAASQSDAFVARESRRG
jgi:peptide/nickel transport system permease protein